MNMIFKVVKNSLGQYTVTSELAKSKGKGKTLKLLLASLGLAPMVAMGADVHSVDHEVRYTLNVENGEIVVQGNMVIVLHIRLMKI
ncbi:hypothetical protein A1D22_08655 [Pasteurellaceae bacterium LFhippo2]|nr:hypothetical protein [Pasteurellaceae bacterium LFhippo2]